MYETFRRIDILRKKSSGVDEDTIVVEGESARPVESKSDEVQSINLLGNKGP